MNTNALRAPTPVSMQPQPSPADRAPQPQPTAKPFAEMLQRSRDGSAAAAVKAAATASPSTPPKEHVDAPVTADESSAGNAPHTARPRPRAVAPPAPSRAPATSHSAAPMHATDDAEAAGDSDTNHEADAGRGLTAPSAAATAAATAAHTAATAAAVAQAVPTSATDASSQAAALLTASARGSAADTDTDTDRAAGLGGDSAAGSDTKAGAGQKHRVDADDVPRSLAARRGDSGHDVGDTKAAAAFALATAEGAAPVAAPHALLGGDLVVGTAVAAGVTAGQAHSSGVEAMPSSSAPLSLPTPIDSPDFAASFGLQVSLLAQDGVQQAELHLNPADMGPVSIHIALDGKEARIDFGADLAATRQAIEHGLPELAGALRDAGFTLAGGGVSQHASERQGSGEGGDGRGGDRDPRAAFRTLPASDAPALARALRHAAAGGVDLYA